MGGLSAQSVSAQRTCEVSGEYRYVVPEDVPLKKARRIAETQARVEAIAAEFGWFVVQSDAMQVQNRDNRSSVDFHSFSESEARGEWLSDRKEPQFTYSIDEHTGRQVVCCRVWGMAREISGAKIPFSAKVLRRLPDPAFESDLFTDGDSFYLYFTAPVDGYLAVYMRDESNTVYCLLPYMRDTDGSSARVRWTRLPLFLCRQGHSRRSRFCGRICHDRRAGRRVQCPVHYFLVRSFYQESRLACCRGAAPAVVLCRFSEVAGALPPARYRHGGRYPLGYDKETLMLWGCAVP